ncbi:hypothetical protein F2Q69_00038935 [Brassica cretica]|uniref:Uncharacterized protein n=1 Tax=Brassica cretica TaxID=69181 RepID=A0A8S9SAD5_BRACR|nr:hypothetical protein F2Q69_00038935 [Brassica cretica]
MVNCQSCDKCTSSVSSTSSDETVNTVNPQTTVITVNPQTTVNTKLGTASNFEAGGTSNSLITPQVPRVNTNEGKALSEVSSAVASDSSDIESSEEEQEEAWRYGSKH